MHPGGSAPGQMLGDLFPSNPKPGPRAQNDVAPGFFAPGPSNPAQGARYAPPNENVAPQQGDSSGAAHIHDPATLLRAVKELQQVVYRYHNEVTILQSALKKTNEDRTALAGKVQTLERTLEDARNRLNTKEKHLEAITARVSGEKGELEGQVRALEADVRAARDREERAREELGDYTRRLRELEQDAAAARDATKRAEARTRDTEEAKGALEDEKRRLQAEVSRLEQSLQLANYEAPTAFFQSRSSLRQSAFAPDASGAGAAGLRAQLAMLENALAATRAERDRLETELMALQTNMLAHSAQAPAAAPRNARQLAEAREEAERLRARVSELEACAGAADEAKAQAVRLGRRAEEAEEARKLLEAALGRARSELSEAGAENSRLGHALEALKKKATDTEAARERAALELDDMRGRFEADAAGAAQRSQERDAELAFLRAELAEKADAADGLTAQLEAARARQNEWRRKASDAQEALEEAEFERRSAAEEREELHDTCRDLSGRLSELEEQNAAYEASVTSFGAKISQLEAERAELAQALEDTRARLDTQAEELARARAEQEADPREDTIEQLEQRTATLSAQNAELEERLNSLQLERSRAAAAARTASARIAELEEERQGHASELDSLRPLRASYEMLLHERDAAQRQAQEARAELGDATAAALDKDSQIKALREELRCLHEFNQSLTPSASRASAVAVDTPELERGKRATPTAQTSRSFTGAAPGFLEERAALQRELAKRADTISVLKAHIVKCEGRIERYKNGADALGRKLKLLEAQAGTRGLGADAEPGEDAAGLREAFETLRRAKGVWGKERAGLKAALQKANDERLSIARRAHEIQTSRAEMSQELVDLRARLKASEAAAEELTMKLQAASQEGVKAVLSASAQQQELSALRGRLVGVLGEVRARLYGAEIPAIASLRAECEDEMRTFATQLEHVALLAARVRAAQTTAAKDQGEALQGAAEKARSAADEQIARLNAEARRLERRLRESELARKELESYLSSVQGDEETRLRNQLRAEREALGGAEAKLAESERELRRLRAELEQQAEEAEFLRGEGAKAGKKQRDLSKENERLLNEQHALRQELSKAIHALKLMQTKLSEERERTYRAKRAAKKYEKLYAQRAGRR
eukprot:gnl/Chilomastix_cuspidata/5868.p1 GENE.gnl/Chilomastix_cuspidata/5868~~gnl/Chilomastix_cuspidata/5868.p1  ORF type:complete len:1132 (-),score=567.54 gnl/Chilomastix_cuspidata/5868:795-4190(-)